MTIRLNRKLKLDKVYRTRDDAGGYVETWHYLGDIWAHIKAGTGNEADLEGLSISTIPYKITVRAMPPGSEQRPTAGQRLRDGERIFRILSVTEIDQGARYLVCTAREEEVSS